ncbi:MAG: glycosyltransferase family 2 protein [Gemmatimonadota bacterium]|nr:glycosyltransferase family 2 protein [Gemmatimonadota bacterium]
MTERNEGGRGEPDLSLIIPCYNEEDVAEYTVQRLLGAFRDAGHVLEIIAVDNGSSDRTPAILQRLEAEEPEVRRTRVEVNEGYGLGVLTGIPLCRGRWAGIIPADGQVDAEDVVRLFDAADSSDGGVLAKVRRRFRMDGLFRKLVSVSYNLFFRALWPRIASLDINGSPKIMPREVLQGMDLRSKDWVLDPEIMVKAHARGLRILEVNVFARMRGGGTSHVRATTCWGFFYRLVRMRLLGPSRGIAPGRPAATDPSQAEAGGAAR